MSEVERAGWWLAWDGKWYPPESRSPGWWLATDGRWYPPEAQSGGVSRFANHEARIPHQLASERIVVQSPLSYAGSAGRIWALTQTMPNPVVRWGVLYPVAVLAVFSAWLFITAWYAVLLVVVPLGGWVIFIPWRLLRRSDRKGKMERRQHREMLAAINRQR